MTNASISAVTTLRISLSMYIFFVYDSFFLVTCIVNNSLDVTFRIALVMLRKIIIYNTLAHL
jgi:hypothetical protein